MKRTVQILLGVLVFPGIVLAHQGHEHASNVPANVQWGLEGAKELINIHPLFVHFPIALLLAAISFYLLGILFKRESFLGTGKWTLFAGTLSAAATVWTGLQAANTVAHGGDIHQTMMAHQYLGFAILGVSTVLSAWVIFAKANLPQRGKKFFFIGLLFLGLVIVQQADLGGRLVFLNGVGVGKKSMMAEESHSPDRGGEEANHHDHGGHAH